MDGGGCSEKRRLCVKLLTLIVTDHHYEANKHVTSSEKNVTFLATVSLSQQPSKVNSGAH